MKNTAELSFHTIYAWCFRNNLFFAIIMLLLTTLLLFFTQTLKNDMSEVKKESSLLDKKVIYGIDLDSMQEGSDALLSKYGKEGVPFIVHYIDGHPKEILYEDITKDDIYHFFQEKDSKRKLELVYFYSPCVKGDWNVRGGCESKHTNFSIQIQQQG